MISYWQVYLVSTVSLAIVQLKLRLKLANCPIQIWGYLSQVACGSWLGRLKSSSPYLSCVSHHLRYLRISCPLLPIITHSLGDEHRDIEETASRGACDKLALRELKATATFLPRGIISFAVQLKIPSVYLIISQKPLTFGATYATFLIWVKKPRSHVI